jgi:hypothetical protein
LSWIPAEDSEKLLGVQVLIAQTGRNAASSLLEWSWQTEKAQMDSHQGLQGKLGTGLKEREREREDRERDGLLEETKRD